MSTEITSAAVMNISMKRPWTACELSGYFRSASTDRTHLSGSRAKTQLAADAQSSRRQTIQNCASDEKSVRDSFNGPFLRLCRIHTYAATIPPTSCATAVIQKRAGVIAPIRHNAKLTLGLKIDLKRESKSASCLPQILVPGIYSCESVENACSRV